MRTLRFAVSDGSRGVAAVVMPAARHAALAIKQRYGNRFWCSARAGGCGNELHLKAGPERVPYFSHRPGQREGCALEADPDLARDAYRHMAIQWVLCRWLRRQGLIPEQEWSFPGGRADIHVAIAGGHQSLEVQLSAIDDQSLRRRDDTYGRHFDHVTWLFAEELDTTASTHLAGRGVAFHVAIDEELSEVQIGTRFIDGTIRWSALDACLLNDGGVHTPFRSMSEAATRRWHLRSIGDGLRRELARRRTQREVEDTRTPSQPASAKQLRLFGGYLPPPSGHFTGAWTLKAKIRYFPEANSWTPGIGWDWLAQLPTSLQESARFLAYFVEVVHHGGPIDELAFADVPDPWMLQIAALADAGFIEAYEVAGILRWRRPTTSQNAGLPAGRTTRELGRVHAAADGKRKQPSPALEKE